MTVKLLKSSYRYRSKKVYYIILIFIISILYIFIPFESERRVYEWSPKFEGYAARLTLIQKEPDKFTLDFPCALLEKESNWFLEAKGGKALQIGSQNGNIALTLGDRQLDNVQQLVFNKTNDCEQVNFIYQADNRKVQIRFDEFVQSFQIPENLEFEIASYLTWNEVVESSEVKVTVETSPRLLKEPSEFKRLLIIVFSLVSIVVVIYYLYKFLRIKSLHLYKSELASLFYLILAGFVVYPMADDDLYLIVAGVFKDSGILTQYQYPVPFPVGYFHATLNSIFIQEQPSIFLLRIFPLLTSFLIWSIFLRNWIHGKRFINRKFLASTWIIWALFSAAFYVSLRAEVYVALFFILSLLIVKKYQQINPENVVFMTIPLAVLAVSFHQSGIVVPFALLPIWIVNLFQIKWREFNFLYLSISFWFSSYVLFINSDPLLLFEKVRDFESVNHWSQPFPGEFKWGYLPWYEYVRLRHIFAATPLQILSIFIFFATLGFLIYLVFKNLRNISLEKFNQNAVLFAITTAPLGLFLAPSKWSGHYSPLLVTTLIGLIFFTGNKFISQSFLLISSICAAVIFLRPWVSGGDSGYSFDLENSLVNLLFRYIVNNDINIYLSFFSISALALILITRKFQLLHTTFLLLITISLLKQIIPTSIDSIIGSSGWTTNRQIALGLINNDSRCGLFNQDRLAELGITQDAKFLFSNNYINSPCLAPVELSKGVWEYPNYVVGGIPVWDQQRLAFRSNIELVECFNDKQRTFEPNLETCVYKWTSEIPDMKLKN